MAAVHHHLIRAGLRAQAALVVEASDAREVMHMALLIGYGAEAVCPALVWETLAALARRGDLADLPGAVQRYRQAVDKGLLKILSKMGISALQSYAGAQVFEAIGLGGDLVARHFTGTASRLGGLGLRELAGEVLARHRQAYHTSSTGARLGDDGEYHYRNQGEHHNWSPLAIATLQQAARTNSAASFAEFERIADEEQARYNLRGLLEPVEGTPVPLDEVEPAAAIVRRFCTGAMSFGSISREAHETLAVAMNRLGGRSNTGEGGEESGRFGGERSSAIKQVASARFGVTTEYLVNAPSCRSRSRRGPSPARAGRFPVPRWTRSSRARATPRPA